MNRIGRYVLPLLTALSLGGCLHDKESEQDRAPFPESPAPVPATQYALSVNVTGSGSISSTPGGIDCGGDCSETLGSGTAFTLTATPASGFNFTGWSGACSGTGTTCALTITADLSAAATFTAITPPPPPPATQFGLTVTLTGSGSVSSEPAGIDCGTDCSEMYAANTSVTLTATPQDGFQFSGWSGDCGSNALSCELAMSADRAVTAMFTIPTPAPGGDSTPPTVSLSTPAAGNVAGTVTVSANATDNVGVVGVQFRVNGVNHGSEDTSAPYSVNWNTTSLTPGTAYTLSAVARDAAGLTTTSQEITVTVQAPPPAPQGLIFFDNFEYEVGRDTSNAISLFQQMGSWTGGKTQQSSTGAHGYLYTATNIPGYNGVFPGGDSTRVLVMEALPNSLGGQTDFYLQYGDGENAAYDNAVPGDVWFQFWVYVNHYGSQLSQINAGKFIYPCNGTYGCHTHKWMLTLSGRSAEPFWESLGTPTYESPTDGSAFMSNIANTIYPADDPATPESESVSTIINTGADQGNEWKLGHTDTSEHFTANRWTLVKIHLDTSTQSGRYEAWMRPLGGAWIKTAEWISGETPGFTWTIKASEVGGHRVFRMPSTIGEANSSVMSYDAWIYMDDFAMASNEAALPRYP